MYSTLQSEERTFGAAWEDLEEYFPKDDEGEPHSDDDRLGGAEPVIQTGHVHS